MGGEGGKVGDDGSERAKTVVRGLGLHLARGKSKG